MKTIQAVRSCLLNTLFGLLIFSPALAQPPTVIPPEMVAARQLIVDSYLEKGVEAYLKFADQNPGTKLAAEALLQAAIYSSKEASQSIYQRIIRDYPRTGYELTARVNLLFLQTGYQDEKSYSTGVDQLVQSFGGPSLQQIRTAPQLGRLTEQILALPLDHQYAMLGAYHSVSGSLRQQRQYQSALALATFNRQTFAKFEKNYLLSDVIYNWIRVNGLDPNLQTKQVDKINPDLKVRPRRGNFGPRPRLTFQTSTGPLPTAQVSLSTSKFLLDGQDFRPQLSVRSRIDQSNGKHRREKPFEILRLSGRPAQPLTPGLHTLSIEIRVEGYQPGKPGLTTYNQTFRVNSPRDDDDDDCDDDRWDRDW